MFARLSSNEAGALRPGDFVTVEILEPSLDNVAVIESRAATQDGRVFIVTAENRLADTKVNILRRQGDRLVVRGLPRGQRYVSNRLPFLAAGATVRLRGSEASGATGGSGSGRKGGGSDDGRGDMVALDEKRRNDLIAAVRANKHLSERRKKRILAKLAQPLTPRRLVERIENRLRGNRS